MKTDVVSKLIQTIVFKGLETFGRHYSCYRGFVLYNIDPNNQSRLFVYVPHISGLKKEGNWAHSKGISPKSQDLPKVGDMVWVEFEKGDYRFPVWSYGHKIKDLNTEPSEPTKVTYGNETGHQVTFDEKNDLTTLKHPNGSKIELTNKTLILNHFNGSEVVMDEDNIKIKQKNISIIIREDGIELGGTSNEGLVKIIKLIESINRLEDKLKSHQHGYINAGGVPTPTTPAIALVPPLQDLVFNNTTKNDLENANVKH